MPSATLTVRELKNKDTGLDISIPTFKETPTLLGSTVEFNVVVVSRLSYFKSPKHKDSDVVQFMVTRKYPDFELLYHQVSEQFHGTIFPPLPKKVLRLSEAVIKDRKARLENFLKFLASTPKLATCSKLLVFLGVNAIKAGQYRKGEVSEPEQKPESEAKDDDASEGDEEAVSTATEENLFGETQDVDETDMFGGGDDQDLFPPDNSLSGGGAEARLFEEQDFGGGLQEGEDEELLGFLPDARTSKKPVSIATQDSDEEDNSDLLKIEDDLDKFLTLDTKADIPPSEEIEEVHKVESESLPSAKPVLKPKPNLSQKPGLPQKPSIKEKPKLKEKPQIPGKKPTLPRKPSQEKPSVKADDTNEPSEVTASKGDILSIPQDNDDILRYIQDNATAGDEDLDLFS